MKINVLNIKILLSITSALTLYFTKLLAAVNIPVDLLLVGIISDTSVNFNVTLEARINKGTK